MGKNSSFLLRTCHLKSRKMGYIWVERKNFVSTLPINARMLLWVRQILQLALEGTGKLCRWWKFMDDVLKLLLNFWTPDRITETKEALSHL